MRSLQRKNIEKWLLVSLLILPFVDNTEADFFFGEPIDMGLGNGGHIWISDNELELYFASDRPGLGYEDIWYSTRKNINDPWNPPVNLETINSEYREAFPSISPDGLTLYFSDYFYGPDRPGGLGGHDLWISTRAGKNDPWNTPINLDVPFNSSSQEISPTISHDGLTFIFGSDRPGGSGGYDLWICTRSSIQDEWGSPVNLGATVNSGSHDYYGNLSPDGLVLFFESNRSGNYEGWKTMRKSINEPWLPPARLPEPLYSMGVGCVSADGSAYYAATLKVPIVPIVEFNGDGIVDSADMCVMIDYWGTDNHLYDIGPMPWGDGIIDVEDLIVLAEHLFEDLRLIAHWPLDETEDTIAKDSANTNDGWLHGDPIWHPEGGKVAGALELDGIDDYISSDYILDPADGNFSVFVWTKGGAPGQTIVSQEGGVNWLMADYIDGSLRTDLKSPATYGREAAPPGPPLISTAVITDGNWHLVGFVREDSERIIYVDDVEVTRDKATDLESAEGGLYIGAGNNFEATSYFSGLIDDVRIYNRAVSP